MKSVRDNSVPRRRSRESTARAVAPPVSAAIEERPPPNAEDKTWAYHSQPAAQPQDLAPIVGANLRRLRVKHGLSLERLARLSGVSRAMLGQVELGHSVPTINIVWKIASALEVPFSALLGAQTEGQTAVLRVNQAKRLSSADGSFSSRALFPFHEPRRVEFYELHLQARSEERADAHSPGTVENLVVSEGSLEIEMNGERHILGRGDAIIFHADVPHVYRNPASTEAVMYLVMTYAQAVS